MDTQEQQIRIDLAASFRLFAKLGMHEAVANHFSAAISEDGKTFLINPKWVHFSRIRASDLVKVSLDEVPEDILDKVDMTAWAIHGQIHSLHPEIRVVMHLHPIYATALSTLENPGLLPIDQNSARYFNRLAIDSLYGGMADSVAEGQRLAKALGDKSRLLMGNHGCMVASHSIGVAFDDMYTLERAAQIQVNALATGKPLHVLADEVAEKTARDWEKIEDFSEAHFQQMKEMLYEEDASFAD